MNKIIFPLRLGNVGPQVADLQAGLAGLVLSIAASEVTNRLFGDSTHLAVRAFQEREHLPLTGDVDALTAARLNQLLEEPAPAGRRVSGRVQHADGSFLRALTVRAFHRRIGGELVLGQSTTSERGEYLIPYEPPPDVTTVDLFVRAFDDKQVIVAVSPIIIGAREQEILDLTVIDPRYRGPSEYARATEMLAPQVAGATLDDLDADAVALVVRNTRIEKSNEGQTTNVCDCEHLTAPGDQSNLRSDRHGMRTERWSL